MIVPYASLTDMLIRASVCTLWWSEIF